MLVKRCCHTVINKRTHFNAKTLPNLPPLVNSALAVSLQTWKLCLFDRLLVKTMTMNDNCFNYIWNKWLKYVNNVICLRMFPIILRRYIPKFCILHNSLIIWCTKEHHLSAPWWDACYHQQCIISHKNYSRGILFMNTLY